MAFMEAQITDKVDWVSVDGRNGVEFLDTDACGIDPFRLQSLLDFLADSPCKDDREYARAALAHVLGDFCKCGTFPCAEPEAFPDISIVKGYGVRSSAPGYTDCTEWSVYSTKREALAAFREEERACRGES